jgi:hypothetical protein
MIINIKKSVTFSVLTALILQLSACGTILYPERKGQSSGQLDSGVVILNSIGLLFFLVPGVIAFAVDFNNGAIYLPHGTGSLDSGDVNIVSIDGEMTNENIEKTVFEGTGMRINLDQESVTASKKLATRSNMEDGVKLL